MNYSLHISSSSDGTITEGSDIHLWFSVGVQSFTIGPIYEEVKQAEFLKRMFEIALSKAFPSDADKWIAVKDHYQKTIKPLYGAKFQSKNRRGSVQWLMMTMQRVLLIGDLFLTLFSRSK